MAGDAQRFASKQDLADKVEWEGGIEETVDYGVRSTSLPADTPKQIVHAWAELEEHLDKVWTLTRNIRKWLEED